MKNMMLSVALGLLLTGGIVSTSSAALIGVTDYGNYFSDAETDLDWMDVTLSIGRSYSDVSGHLGAGGDYQGWRYATASEFGVMLTSVTGEASNITGPAQNSGALDENQLEDVISILGDTFGENYMNYHGISYCDNTSNCVDGDMRYTYGILADPQYSYGNYIHTGIIYDDDRYNSIVDYISTTGIVHQSFPNSVIGSFLVRNTAPVPEPSTFLLLGSGLVGLAFWRKRQA